MTSPKWQGLHPELARRLSLLHAVMEAWGYPMMLTDGVRTAAEQEQLYSRGRYPASIARHERVVTNCDGTLKKSNHQTKADGYGYAADSAFVIDGKPSWDERLPWQTYGKCALIVGLKWGIKLNASTVDKPHVEWAPEEVKSAISVQS